MVAHGLPGVFIVVEGPHGSGKSTLAASLAVELESLGTMVNHSKEPYVQDFLPLIRSFSMEPQQGVVLAALIAADRYLHVTDIKKHLQEGHCVISDRYVPSSLVYQGMQGIQRRRLLEWNDFALDPDVTFFIRTPVEQRVPRLSSRMDSDHFLKMKQIVHEQTLYEEIVSDSELSGKFSIHTLDGQAPAAQVLQQALSALKANPRSRRCLLG